VRIGATIGLVGCAALLLGASCPTREELLPPTLGAPSVTTTAIVGHQVPDGYSDYSYSPCVHLAWQAPDTASIGVTEYTILRKAGPDSLYRVLVHDIPANVLDFFDPVDNLVPKTFGVTDTVPVLYQVYATDSLGRTGDTSAPALVVLWHEAKLTVPAENDTVRSPVFGWTVSNVPTGYYTYMFLWDSTGLVWQSTKPTSSSFTADTYVDPFSATVPDSVLRRASGRLCFWGAKIDVINPIQSTATGSVTIGKCYVP
jgi:hypothetical protein